MLPFPKYKENVPCGNLSGESEEEVYNKRNPGIIGQKKNVTSVNEKDSDDHRNEVSDDWKAALSQEEKLWVNKLNSTIGAFRLAEETTKINYRDRWNLPGGENEPAENRHAPSREIDNLKLLQKTVGKEVKELRKNVIYRSRSPEAEEQSEKRERTQSEQLGTYLGLEELVNVMIIDILELEQSSVNDRRAASDKTDYFSKGGPKSQEELQCQFAQEAQLGREYTEKNQKSNQDRIQPANKAQKQQEQNQQAQNLQEQVQEQHAQNRKSDIQPVQKQKDQDRWGQEQQDQMQQAKMWQDQFQDALFLPHTRPISSHPPGEPLPSPIDEIQKMRLKQSQYQNEQTRFQEALIYNCHQAQQNQFEQDQFEQDQFEHYQSEQDQFEHYQSEQDQFEHYQSEQNQSEQNQFEQEQFDNELQQKQLQLQKQFQQKKILQNNIHLYQLLRNQTQWDQFKMNKFQQRQAQSSRAHNIQQYVPINDLTRTEDLSGANYR